MDFGEYSQPFFEAALNIFKMNDRQPEEQDLFALVTYTPDPLHDSLLRLRQILAIEANSQPHITILPPRPLRMPVNEAKHKIGELLARWPAFEIELSGIALFPNTNVLYLEVSHGNEQLSRLHAELNVGEFAHTERFPFHPHVTVGGPVPAEEIGTVARKAVEFWNSGLHQCRFTIDDIACVSIAAGCARGDWRRLWVHQLALERGLKRLARTAATSQTS